MSKRFSGLEIEERADEDRRTLALGGELDIGSVPVLHAAIARVTRRRRAAHNARPERADLHRLDRPCGDLLTSRLCDRDDLELTLTPGAPGVQRLFELTGLIDALPFSSTSETRPPRRYEARPSPGAGAD
jgi:ABC-type transporter Mla MlaB component